MKKTPCVVCKEKKGQRICLMHSKSLICSLCCANIRNDQCGDCSHFVQAKKYGVEKNRGKSNRPFVARFSSEVDALVDKALEHVEKGELETGERLIDDLVRQHPDLCVVHYGKGTVSALQKKYGEALDAFDKCLEIFPLFTDAWFNKALVHKELCDFSGMVKSLQMVVKYGAGDNGDHIVTAGELLEECRVANLKNTGLSLETYLDYMDVFDQGFLCIKNEEYEQAIGLFTKIVEGGYANHCQSHGNIGLCHMFLGKNTEALAALDRALEIDPNYEPAAQNRELLLSLPVGETISGKKAAIVDYYRDVVRKVG